MFVFSRNCTKSTTFRTCTQRAQSTFAALETQRAEVPFEPSRQAEPLGCFWLKSHRWTPINDSNHVHIAIANYLFTV